MKRYAYTVYLGRGSHIQSPPQGIEAESASAALASVFPAYASAVNPQTANITNPNQFVGRSPNPELSASDNIGWGAPDDQYVNGTSWRIA